MASANSYLKKVFKLTIAGLAAVTLVTPIALQMGASPAFSAEEKQKPKPTKRKTKVIESLNAPVAKALQKASEKNEEGDLDGVLKILDGLMKKYDTYNTTSKANIWQFYAFIYYQKENVPKAIESYRKLVSVPQVQEKAEALYKGGLYSIAQMYFLSEDYRNAVKALETWFKVTEEPGATAWVLLGQGYYQLDNYDKALPAVLKAIAIFDAKGKEVKENWYLLARAMYYSKEDYQKTFDILRILVHKYPKKQYYSQLAAMYGQLNKDFEQYSGMVAMNDANMLDKNSELIVLSQLLLQNDLPHKAGLILEKGLKAKQIKREESNLKLLANAWILSKEDAKAIIVLEEAAKISDTGDTYASLGQTYLNVDKWDEALKSINNAFKKGKLKREDTAYIVKGMALFNLKKYNAAIKAFNQAKKDKRSRKIAHQWLKYVTSERDRAKALAKGLT